MSHSHLNHDHNHSHNHESQSTALLIVLIITALYMVAEFLGGLYSNSLALTADAGHMLGDVGALILSYFAIWLSGRKAPPEKTFGYFRAEIFAAFINGIALIVIALIIIYEAYLRMISPPEVKSFSMIVIAFGGLIVNIIGVFLLHKGSENLNIKGAFLHIVGDLLGSIGAIIAGILIYFGHFYIADPVISFIIAGFILYSSINLTNSAVQVLMETAPSHIDTQEIKTALLGIKDVIDVHDLHIWSITSNKVSLSVHVVAEPENNKRILEEIDNMLINKFKICHSAIQIEPKDFHEPECPLDLQ